MAKVGPPRLKNNFLFVDFGFLVCHWQEWGGGWHYGVPPYLPRATICATISATLNFMCHHPPPRSAGFLKGSCEESEENMC